MLRLHGGIHKADDDAALAKAAAAETAGRPEEAARLFEAATRVPVAPPPAFVLPKPLPPPAPKLAGGAERKIWFVESVDMAMLPDEFKKADMVRLDKMATEFKDRAVVPGVKFAWRIGSAIGKL